MPAQAHNNPHVCMSRPPRFTIFCLDQGAMVAPEAGMWQGTTRRALLGLAPAAGLNPDIDYRA